MRAPRERYGFPKQDASLLSYWLETVQGDLLLHHRSTPELPLSADIVVIGSGASGSMVAKKCIETWPEKSVVVLEARMFCSGATGRNAGHCKPDQWRGFDGYQREFGTEMALKILQNEQHTWSEVVGYVRRHEVDCDLWVGDTLDVPLTPEAAAIAKATFERCKAAGGKVDHVKVTHDPAEAEKISRLKGAQACYAWNASTVHPWKLVAHVMRECLKRGVNLQTHTQVTGVVASTAIPGRWVVQTAQRGDIECAQVVHATNAYSAALEPMLRGLVRPQPHMCNLVVPPPAYRGARALPGSYGVLAAPGVLYSINPQKPRGGPILFGGSNPGQDALERWLDEHPERCVDDDIPGFPPVTEAVWQLTEGHFAGWPSGPDAREELYKRVWSGIIAMSEDNVPFVGELPGLPGQWICAGHNGHGMARIFTAAPGLVKLMGGGSWVETKLPEVFEITAERLSRLQQRVAATDPALSRL